MSGQDGAGKVLVTRDVGESSDEPSVMNFAGLQRKLLAAARANPPSDAVPYAFEKRVMAHLLAKRPVDGLTLWGRALWHAAGTCLVITLMLSGWSVWADHRERSAAEFSEQFETAIFVMAEQADESW